MWRRWPMTGRKPWDLLAAAPFDLVLTDIRMPRVDGLALAAWVAGQLRRRPR